MVPAYLIVNPYDPTTSDLISTYQRRSLASSATSDRGATDFSPDEELPKYFYPTGTLSGGYTIGQVGSGVYVYNDENLTKIGYTAYGLRRTYGAAAGAPVAPLAFGERSVSWIGKNGILYVAHVSESMPHTGILDAPTDVPFRTQSDPTVYLEPAKIHARSETFETANEYIERFDDPNFENVIWIPDNAEGVENLPE